MGTTVKKEGAHVWSGTWQDLKGKSDQHGTVLSIQSVRMEAGAGLSLPGLHFWCWYPVCFTLEFCDSEGLLQGGRDPKTCIFMGQLRARMSG